MSGGSNPANPVPKKVRLACRRCRTRRIKCDGQVPACSNCAKAQVVCWDIDGQNSELVIPRNFIHSARLRIQWLEEIIRTRLPDVDLTDGPRVASVPEQPQANPATPTQPASEVYTAVVEADDVAPASSAAASRQSAGTKRRAESWASHPERDEPFSEQAHSVAVNLGMLSLNSDSSQRHYLGSSSGVLFTNLIGASPSSTSAYSTPAPSGPVQEEGPVPEGPSSSLASVQTSLQRHYVSLHTRLREELPRHQDAVLLAQTYIRCIHPEWPVIEPASLLSAIEALYACSTCTLADDALYDGWPSSIAPFRWNGNQIRPGQRGTGVPMPVVAFVAFMVFNIAAIVKVWLRVYEFPPDRYYRAAVFFSPDCFSQITVPTLQSLIMLIVHCLHTPADANLWTLIHVAMAHCVELGIHREQPADALPHDREIRRMVFYTTYSLDRTISSIQGRPLGLRDETFDVRLPEMPARAVSQEEDAAMPSDRDVLSYSIYRFEIDKIVSNIKTQLYHLPVASDHFSWPPDLATQQSKTYEQLKSWRARMVADFREDDRQRLVCRLKLQIRFHNTIILLFQPSQAIRRPPESSLQLVFDSASAILRDYQTLHDSHGVHHGWRTVQNIFAAGAALIYSFWTCEAVQQRAIPTEVSKHLRTCSNLLSVGGEWWPSVRKALANFGSIVDLTIQKLYTRAVGPRAKQRRIALSQPFTSGPPSIANNNASLHHDDHLRGEQTHTQKDQQMLRGNIRSSSTPGTWPGDIYAEHPAAVLTTSFEGPTPQWDSSTPTRAHWLPGGLQVAAETPTGGGHEDEMFPEIEHFLEDFDRSEFTWTFPLNGASAEDPLDLDMTALLGGHG